ncbi:hypothetical protein AR540_23975 [Pseudomonas sp. EpS/L25]|nr:hypothetical protein AR540_23975 [Pseudomonas sp. EpS/L25]
MSTIAVIVVSFIILAVFLANQLRASTENAGYLFNQDFLPTNTINQIDGTLTRIDINILRMIAIGDPKSVARWKTENEAAFKRVEESLRVLDRQLMESPQHPMIKDLQATYELLRDGMRQQTAVIEQGDLTQAALVNRELVKPNADRIFPALEQLRSTSVARAEMRLNDQIEETRNRLYSAMCAIGIITLLSCILGWLIVRHIMSQIGGEPSVVANLTRSIAAGDLTNAIQVRRGAERSVMAAVSEMQQQLRVTLTQISTSAHAVAESSITLSRITDLNAKDLTQQGNEVDQAVTAVTQMSSAVEEVARNAEHTSRSSQQAAFSVKEGESQVHLTSEAIRDMSDGVRNTALLIERLAQQAHGVGRVVDVIRGLADQTNLLALNAAIEAARAGEAGRGFAVVADEVRALAHRTQASTQEIEQLISSIQEGSSQAENAMDAAVDLAGTTLDAAAKANAALQLINRSVGEISELNLVIASAAQEQAQVSREVDQNLLNIRNLSVQSNESALEVTRSSEALNQLASQLNGVVANFRIR